MVVGAQEHHVFFGGESAVGVVLNVVGLGECWLVIAVGVGTPLVAGDESAAEFGWCGAVPAAHVQYFAV